MLRGEILFSNKETDLALKIYTEVLNLFPDVLEAYEMRAQCYLIGVREKLFNKKTAIVFAQTLSIDHHLMMGFLYYLV